MENKPPKTNDYDDIDLDKRNYSLPSKEKILKMEGVVTPEVNKSTDNQPVKPVTLAIPKTVVLPAHQSTDPGGTQVLWGASPAIASIYTHPEQIADDDSDLAATSYYLPSRKDISKPQTASDLDEKSDSNGSLTEQDYSATVALLDPLPQASVPDPLFAQSNTPITPPAQDSLRPIVTELPHRIPSLEESSLSGTRSDPPRKSSLRLLRVGVLTVFILGVLGCIVLSAEGFRPSNNAANVLTPRKQAAKPIESQSTSVHKKNVSRAEKPRVTVGESDKPTAEPVVKTNAPAESPRSVASNPTGPSVLPLSNLSERGVAKISRDESAITASPSTHPHDQLQPERSGAMPVNRPFSEVKSKRPVPRTPKKPKRIVPYLLEFE